MLGYRNENQVGNFKAHQCYRWADKGRLRTLGYRCGSESEIINRLRKDGDLYLSMVSIH